MDFKQHRRAQPSDFYHQETVKLVRSMVIKSHHSAKIMNDVVDSYFFRYGLSEISQHELNPKEWRYYKHLHGEYHDYDLKILNGKKLEITSLDTYQKIPFDKDVLKKHRSTLEHYRNQDIFYQDLIKRYPDFHLLIDGICRPIDKEFAIQAKDYTILSYHPNFIEPQEISLIEELNQMIQAYILRFNSLGYEIHDKLYPAMKLGILAMHLPSMIVALREQKVGTTEAHSFHIWNRLASIKEIDEFRPYLTREQMLWLYRHLRYIDKNAGVQATFDKLMQRLLTDRDIGLYNYSLTTKEDNLVVEKTKLNLNKVAVPEEIKVEDLFEKENELTTRNGEFREEHVDKVESTFRRNVNSTRKTKLLESEIFDYSSQERFPLEEIGLNYWIYLANKKKYELVGSTQHPVLGEYITLNSKEALIVWCYLIMRLINVDYLDKKTNEIKRHVNIDNILIPTLHAKDILDPKANQNEIRGLFNKGINLTKAMNDLTIHYPEEEVIFSSGQFRDKILEVQRWLKRHHFWTMVHEDLLYHKDIKHYGELHLTQHAFPLVDSEMTFGEWLTEKNLSFANMSDEDLLSMANEIYIFFTGVVTNKDNQANKIQKAMLSLFKRLSSYTIQFVSRVNVNHVKVIENLYLRWGDVERTIEAKANLFKRFFLKFSGVHSTVLSSQDLSGQQPNDEAYGFVSQEATIADRPILEASHYPIFNTYIRPSLLSWTITHPEIKDSYFNQYYLYRGTLYQYRDIYIDEYYHDIIYTPKQGERGD